MVRVSKFSWALLVFLVGTVVGIWIGFGAELLGRDGGEAGVGSAASGALSAAATGAAASSGTDTWSDIPAGLTREEERDIIIFREVSPSVVNISNISLRRDFFSLDVFEIPRGTGSGFVWDDSGHIVTNYHVVAGASRWKVTLGGEDWDASLVGTSPNKDLAVLRIDAPRQLLQPLILGQSANLLVGQKVLAVGNPFGLDQTLTMGIVSALERELTSPGGLPIRDVIQTDAAINPGNSGGPLLDSQGRLIGVNTAIYSPSGASAGIGFAVPVDTVRRLVPQVIEYGRPLQPGIGVDLVSDRLTARFGVRGVIVRGVMRGGPAERAGIEGLRQTRRGQVRLGDVIVAIGDEPVRSIRDLILAFDEIGVGGRAQVTLERDGERRAVELDLVAIE